MAKDPAFLFYSNDFTSGTQFFTNEEVGIYIRLMCAQHQHGRLTEKQVKIICNSLDNDVLKKFCIDENGLYYNKRLEYEVERRRNYSASRSGNRKGKTKSINNQSNKNNISKSYVNHMENENEIENKDIIIIPEYTEFINYVKTLQPYKPELDFAIQSKYESWIENKWKDGNNKKIKNWKTKIKNTITFLKPIYKEETKPQTQSKLFKAE